MLRRRDPAVQSLMRELQQRIERGVYPAGAWLPTERDLALEFSVQRAGVRAALEALAEQGLIVRPPGRRPWVRERRAGEQAVRSLHRQLLRNIAAILPHDSSFSSSVSVLGGINDALKHSDAPLRLTIHNNYTEPRIMDPDEEIRALETVRDDAVAGVIIWPMDVRRTLPYIQSLREQGIPVVFVDRYAPNWDGDFVGVDNRHAAGEAVDYLMSLGHRRIGFVADDETEITTTTEERRNGYHDALLRRRLAFPELICMMPPGVNPESRAADYFIGLAEPPTAVFANNDCTAYHFIEELEKRGLQVPRDMSVIGFDDSDRFSPRPARLTTMQQPFHQIGRRAAEILLRRIASQEHGPWQHILLPTPLIVRETCAATAGGI